MVVGLTPAARKTHHHPRRAYSSPVQGTQRDDARPTSPLLPLPLTRSRGTYAPTVTIVTGRGRAEYVTPP